MTRPPTDIFWNTTDQTPGTALRGNPLTFHQNLPGYEPSPVVELTDLAQTLGVGRISAKIESTRLGLPAFKILGASWATYRELCRRFPGVENASALEDICQHISPEESLTFVAATDGNHGRAVAHMARLLGQKSHILVPAGMTMARIRAIEGEGAVVEVVDGTYDDAIAKSATLADDTHIVISDTSWEGYRDVPADVIDGYSTIFDEFGDQVDSPPTHLFIQMGVGALGAAAIRAAQTWDAKITSVEPGDADCILQSLRAGDLAEVPGPHRSIMAGLNCGLPSPLAWPELQASIDLAIAIPDEDAREAMRALADASVIAGETGAAGLAGLLALAATDTWPDTRDRISLDDDSHILILITEGATDPEAWETITGQTL